MNIAIGSHHKKLVFGRHANLPLVLQTEASECGLACLAMIASFHGHTTDLTRLRQRFSISAHGATLKNIIDIAGQLNLSSRALKLDLSDLPALQTPCILHWDMKHFVVLKNCTKDAITIMDPALGERKVPMTEVDRLFTGVALELTPAPNFEPQDDKQTLHLNHFWSRIRGLKRSLGFILALSLMLQLFAIISPYYMQTVIDDVIVRSNTSLLTVLALGFTLLLLIEVGTSIVRQYAILYLSNTFSLQMASNVFHHLIRLPLDYFSKRHMGDVVSRFSSLTTIRELLTTGVITALVDGLMAIITLCVMFIYDAWLALIVIAVVFLYALLRFLFYQPLRRLNEEAIIASAKENSHFMESIRGVQTIKLFGQESNRQQQWLNHLTNSMNKHIQISRWDIGFSSCNKVLFGFESIVIVYFAAHAVMENVMSIGMLYAFVSYKTRFIGAMDGLIAKWIEFKMLSLHFERVADVVFTDIDPMLATAEAQSSQILPDSCGRHIGKGQLVIDSISYRYSPQSEPLFSAVSLDIEPGCCVAIVGASGSGKSTLLKCMMGLFPSETGDIQLDGQSLKTKANYRQQIGAVLQDDNLLSGTIAENIACFDDNIDIQRVVEAAQIAHVHHDILATSMQYNTLVGDMGANLSGGQIQRLLLARALYRKPSVLFLDEATSHLDTENEQHVSHHLNQLSMTRVIVAHRLETIQRADRIFELIGGTLQEVELDPLVDN